MCAILYTIEGGGAILKYYLGIDLGGTNVAIGVVSEDGRLLHKDSVPTASHRGYTHVAADMIALCKQVVADSGLTMADIASVGIGSPGHGDSATGVIVYASNLGFSDVPICALLSEGLSIPAYLNNDANCAALGESISGAAKDTPSSVTITLGTGVGGGIIIDGKIMSGAFGGGGEVGHMCISFDGEACPCGGRGCWEAYASATGLIRQAKMAMVRHPESLLATEARHDLSLVNGKFVFDVADMGDQVAQDVIEQYLRYVAVGLSNVIDILQPDTIVVGGGISAQGDRILRPIAAFVREMVFGALSTKLVTATLGNDAGIIGAAMFGMDRAAEMC